MDLLEPVKDDDEAVKEIGCQIAGNMCQQILTAVIENDVDGIDGVHFVSIHRLLVYVSFMSCNFGVCHFSSDYCISLLILVSVLIVHA